MTDLCTIPGGIVDRRLDLEMVARLVAVLVAYEMRLARHLVLADKVFSQEVDSCLGPKSNPGGPRPSATTPPARIAW